MIDFKNAYELRNVLSNKVIDKIQDNLGNIWYEAWKELTLSGILPLTLSRSKGVDLVDYKIYGESVQEGEPTPETPVEIESVGDKTKNLFDKDNFISLVTGQTGVSFETKDDRNCVKLVATNYPSIFLFKFDSSKSYVISFYAYLDGDGTAMGAGFGIKMADNTIKYALALKDRPKVWAKRTLVIEGGNYLYLTYGQNTPSYIDLDTIQIEEGSVETPYEPYGYKIPLTVRGKNLLNSKEYFDEISKTHMGVTFTVNSDGSIKAVGTVTGTSHSLFYIQRKSDNIVYSAGTYVLSGGISGRYIDENGDSVYPQSNKVFTLNQDTIFEFIYIAIAPGETVDTTYYPQMQKLENGTSTVSEFETYIEPVTTNIYLDEPLKKVGDYADYIDFENQKVVRNIKELDISGLTWKTLYSGDNMLYYCVISDTTITELFNPLCNILPSALGISSTDTNIGVKIYNSNIVRARPNIEDYPTLDDWNAYLKNNSMIIYYASETPTEETIELPNIPTHKGTTTIDIDTTIAPSNMNIKYIGKG